MSLILALSLIVLALCPTTPKLIKLEYTEHLVCAPKYTHKILTHSRSDTCLYCQQIGIAGRREGFTQNIWTTGEPFKIPVNKKNRNTLHHSPK